MPMPLSVSVTGPDCIRMSSYVYEIKAKVWGDAGLMPAEIDVGIEDAKYASINHLNQNVADLLKHAHFDLDDMEEGTRVELSVVRRKFGLGYTPTVVHRIGWQLRGGKWVHYFTQSE